MKTNDTQYSARSVVVQTTLRVCEVDDGILVISDRGCQTITTTIPTTDNQAVIPFLEFTPFSEIVKDSQKVIDLPRKALLQFDLNHRVPKRSASELNPKSALKKSVSGSDKLSAENLILSLVSYPKMPQKTQDEQEIQTNLTVSPFILDEDDVANVCAQLSVQTSITFEPTDSLSEITTALKKALKHTQNFQSVIVDGKIVTDYVDSSADEEQKKKRNGEEDDKTEDSSSAEGGQESEDISEDLKKKKEKPSLAKIEAKQSSKIEERYSSKAIKSAPVLSHMNEEEFERNVQKILDKTVKNVYDFMAKIVEMYEQSKEKEQNNVELSPEMKERQESEKKISAARRLFPTLEEEDEEQSDQKDDEPSLESPVTTLQSETLDKSPTSTGSSFKKLLSPDDALDSDTPVEAPTERKRSSALRMVTGLVRGPKWVIQKALGVDVDTGLPTPGKKESIPKGDITLGTEVNLDDSQCGVEFVALESKEAIERLTPRKETISKLQGQETIDDTPESTAEVVEKEKSTVPLDIEEGKDISTTSEQEKRKEFSTPTPERPITNEDGIKTGLDESLPEIQFVPVNNDEATNYFTPKNKLQRTDALEETPESTTEESKLLENDKSKEMFTTEMDTASRSTEQDKNKESGDLPETETTEDVKQRKEVAEQENDYADNEKSKQTLAPSKDKVEATPENEEQDVSGIEPKGSVSPVKSMPNSQIETINTVENEDIGNNTESPETPPLLADIANDDMVTSDSTAAGQPTAAEDIGDSPSKSSSDEIACECGAIHEGGAAPPGLSDPPAVSAPRSQQETSIKFELTLLNDGKLTQNTVEGLIVKAAISRVDTRKDQSDGGTDVINVSVIVGSQQITASSIGDIAIGGPPDSDKQEDSLFCSCVSEFESPTNNGSKVKLNVEKADNVGKCSRTSEFGTPMSETNIVPEKQSKLSKVEIKPPRESKSQIICSCEHESTTTGSAKPSKAEIKPSAKSDSRIICSCKHESKSGGSVKASKAEIKPPPVSKSQMVCSCENESIPTGSAKSSKVEVKPSTEKSQIICSCKHESKPSGPAKPSKVEIKPSAESKSQIVCSCEIESKPTGSAKPSKVDVKPSIEKSQIICSCEHESKSTRSATPSKVEIEPSADSKSQIVCSCENESKPSGSAKPSKVDITPSMESKATGTDDLATKSQRVCSCENESKPTGSAKPSKGEVKPSIEKSQIICSCVHESKPTGSATPSKLEIEPSADSKSQIVCSCENESKPTGSAKPSNVEIRPSMESKETDTHDLTTKPQRVCSCKHNLKSLTLAKQSEAGVPFTSSVKQSKVILKTSIESKEKSKDDMSTVLRSQELVVSSMLGISKSSKASEVELKPPLESAKQSRVEFAKEAYFEAESPQLIKCSCIKDKEPSATSAKQSEGEFTHEINESDSEEFVECDCGEGDKTPITSALHSDVAIAPRTGSTKPSRVTMDRFTELKQKSDELVICSCSKGPNQPPGSEIQCKDKVSIKSDNLIPKSPADSKKKKSKCPMCARKPQKILSSLKEMDIEIKRSAGSEDPSTIVSKLVAGIGICNCLEECKVQSCTGPVKQCGSGAFHSESQLLLPCSCKISITGKQEICSCTEECELKMMGPLKLCGVKGELIESTSGTQGLRSCNCKKSKLQAKHEICTCTEECKLKTLTGPVKECGPQSKILKSGSDILSESEEIFPCNCQMSTTRANHDICTCVEECQLKTLTGPMKECGTRSDILKSKSAVESESQEILPCSCNKSKIQAKHEICTCVEECQLKTLTGPVKECGTQSDILKSSSAVKSESQEILPCNCRKSKIQTKHEMCTCVEECQLKTLTRSVKECGTQSEILKSSSAVESKSQEILPCSCKKSKIQAKREICTCVQECQLKTLTGPVKECGTQSEILKSSSAVESESQEILPCSCKKSKIQTKHEICTCVKECKLKTLTGPVKECGTASKIIKSQSLVKSKSQELLPCSVCKKTMIQTKQDTCTSREELELKRLTGQVKECGTQSQLAKNRDSQKVFPRCSAKPIPLSEQNMCTCTKKSISKSNICECKSQQSPKQSASHSHPDTSKLTPNQICVCKEPLKLTTSIQDAQISYSKSLPSNVKQSRSEICVCKIQSKPTSQSIIKSQLSSIMKVKPVSQKEITCTCKRSDALEQLQGDTCLCKTKELKLSMQAIKSDKTKEELILGPLNVCTCADEKPTDVELKKNECPCSLQENNRHKESIENYVKKLLQDAINTKDPELIQQHAACLEPYLQQLAENLDDIEGIGGKEIRCTGDASQQCVCSVEVLYVSGETQPPGKVDKSCACSILRVKKSSQDKPLYRESISKYCSCDMENEPTANLECMYEEDEDYNEMYMEELGDNGFGYKLQQAESESECTCNKNELPEVVVDSDMCGTSIEMPWLSIALPPPGTYEIISNKPPKKICECWNLDLKDSVLSATEVGTGKEPACECTSGKPQGSILLQQEGGSVHQPSKTAQLEVILPPSEEEEKPCRDATKDSSSDDESGCSCSIQLDECEDLPIGSTKFVYDNPCYAQNEPYMDQLYKYFPDDCDTYCGPFTEIHWSDILLPKKIKLRQAPKPKSTAFCEEVTSVALPTTCAPMEATRIAPCENENTVSAKTSELEIEICFAEVASTLLKVEGGADSQHTVSEISTISDVRMKVKRCPKDYVVTVFAEGKYQHIEGGGLLTTVGSQPFTFDRVEENVSNFLVAIQTAPLGTNIRQPEYGVSRDVTTDAAMPKKFSSLPNMSVASLTSAEFHETFPRAFHVDYFKDEPELLNQQADNVKQSDTTEEQIQPGTCYPCRKREKEIPPGESKITNENKKDVNEKPKKPEKTSLINKDAVSVDTIKSGEFRQKYNLPSPEYEDPHAMGLYTYTMPEMEQRILDIPTMMRQNLALIANESSSAIEKPKVVVQEPKAQAKVEKPLGSIKPSCRCSQAERNVIKQPKVGTQLETPLGSVKRPCPCSKANEDVAKEPKLDKTIDKHLAWIKPSCRCTKTGTTSKINIQEITKKEMQSINATINEIKSKLLCMDIPELDNWRRCDIPDAPRCSQPDPYSTMQKMPQLPKFPAPYQFAQPSQAPTMYPSCYYPNQYTYSGNVDYSMYNTTYPAYSTYMDSDITEEDYICTCVKRKAAKKRKRQRKIRICSSEYSCASTCSSGSKITASAKSIPSGRKSCRKAKPASSETDSRYSQVSFCCDTYKRSQANMEIMEYSHYDHTATDTDPEVEIRVGRGPPKIKTKNTFKGMITKEPNKCKFKVEIKLSPSKLRNLQKKKSLNDTESSSCERLT